MSDLFNPLFDVVTAVLAWFYSLYPNYGVAIALLTLTAVVAVTPLTLKMTRNMLQMQQHMPELKKLQSQYKGDRQAMNEATAAFYKEHRINPVGCLLPMLVQGPIFLVMYRVVDGLTRRTTEIGTQLGYTSRLDAGRYADSAFGQVPEYATTPISRGELAFDPDFLSRDTELYETLSTDVEMVTLGVDLSRSASSALSASIVSALPYFVMILVVLVTSLYQQRQIQGRQSQAAMPPQQQMMMKLIPYMLPVFSYVMPAAVVTYFIVSNLVRIAQQAYITRSFYRGEDSLGAQVAKQRVAAQEEDSAGANAKHRSPRSVTERKGAPTPKRDAGAARGKAPARRRDAGAKATKAPARGRDAGAARGKAPARRRGAAASGTAARERPSAAASGKAASGKASAGKAASGKASTGRTASGKTGKAPSRGRTTGRTTTGRTTTSGRTTPPGSGPKRTTPNRSRNKKKRR